jgi:hypothetical protein
MPWTQHSTTFFIISCTTPNGGPRPAPAATSSAMLWGRQSVHAGYQTCKRVALGSKLLVLRHRCFWESVWYRLLPKKYTLYNHRKLLTGVKLRTPNYKFTMRNREYSRNILGVLWLHYLQNHLRPNVHLCPFPVAKGRRVGNANEVSWFCIVLLTHKDNGQITLLGVFFREWLPFTHAVCMLVKCGYVHCVVRACWQLYISITSEKSVGSAHLVWTNCGIFLL